MTNSNWRLYQGHINAEQPLNNDYDSALEAQTTLPSDHPLAGLPPPPPWRQFRTANRDVLRGAVFQPDERLIDVINMALYLRRPLLITGKPGTGKSSVAAAVAQELELGRLLRWPINTRSTLQDGLYTYDAVRRLQDTQLYVLRQQPGNTKTPIFDPVQEIGKYITLGPLGTAMLSKSETPPRALLIDEIDKSDIDLPNDLLNIFEEGEYEIPEIRRHQTMIQDTDILVLNDDKEFVRIPADGRIRCQEFPVITGVLQICAES